MAIFSKLRLAFTSKNVDDSGTDHWLNLTVNIDGKDILDQDFGGGLDDGEAVVTSVAVLPTPVDSNTLTNSSIRLGIRGHDAWAPEHVMVLGEAEPSWNPSRITFALAMETDQTRWLSSDASEGRLTMPLRLVASGSPATVVRRVLLMVHTSSEDDAGTDSSVQLQITAGGSLVLQEQLPDTPGQPDLEPPKANWYLLNAAVPFTFGDLLSNGGVRLAILGDDAWKPRLLFVFGLDTATGRPNEVVTMVSISEWNAGVLSTDLQEGASFINLPLASG